METEHLYDMYVTDDIDLIKPSAAQEISLSKKGILQEISVGDTKVSVVDPVVVQRLETVIRSLQTKITILEQELRSLQSRMDRTEHGLREARSELNNKVGYE